MKGFLEREKIPMPLPASLALRKEVTDLPQTLAGLRDEAEVRRVVEDLNERIRDSHRRRIDGPALVLRPVDVDGAVAQWRGRRER